MDDEKKPDNTPDTSPKEPITEAPATEEVTTPEEDVQAPEQTSDADTVEVVAEVVEPENYSKIEPGMTVRVYQKIKETNSKGVEKERLQFFEGIILARSGGNEVGSTITVRKISHGVGVEKIFPLQLPTLTKIEVLKKLQRRRRSKLFFLRHGYKKRLKEIKVN